MTGYYALRGFCYTPLPDANAVVLRPCDRDRERLARARAEIAGSIALHNFGALSRLREWGRVRKRLSVERKGAHAGKAEAG